MLDSRIVIATSPNHLPGSPNTVPSLILPSSGIRADDAITRLFGESQRAVRLPHWRGPFAPGEIRLDTNVLSSSRLVAVVNLDLIGQRGPFVLDLLARYLSPMARAKLITLPNRIETIARINLTRRFDRIVITRKLLKGEVWIETNDPIAGELVCLALSEDLLPGGRSMTSPWEDELVQRATEHDLGARYPGDIRAELLPGYVRSDPDPVLMALHLRLAIDILGH